MRKMISVTVLVALLACPGYAEAGLRSSVKKAAVKVGHVFENALYVAAATGVVILVCRAGACD